MRKNMIKVTNTATGATVRIVCPTSNTNTMLDLLKETGAQCVVYESNCMTLTDLPEEVQAEAKETLTMFDSVNVIFEYGRFEVTPNTCIKAHYNHDRFFCGTYYADDVYTKEERRQHRAELDSYDFPEWAW